MDKLVKLLNTATHFQPDTWCGQNFLRGYNDGKFVPPFIRDTEQNRRRIIEKGIIIRGRL